MSFLAGVLGGFVAEFLLSWRRQHRRRRARRRSETLPTLPAVAEHTVLETLPEPAAPLARVYHLDDYRSAGND